MPEGSVLAHVGRAMAISGELRGPDVQISFASAGTHAERLQDTGLRVHPVTTLPREDLMARLGRGGSAFSVDTLRSYVRSELSLLRELRPDCVVGDFRASLSISAAAAGVPYVCVTNAVWTRYCAFDLAPPSSWLPTKLLGARVLNAVRPWAEPMVFRLYARPFNTVRAEYGLEPQSDLRDCMCSSDLTLVADAEELFPTRDLPAHFRVVGPVLWEPAVPEPDWLGELDPGIPTVYLTMGSTGPLAAMQALSRKIVEAGLQVICTTATRCPTRWPDDPRMFAVRYAPGSRMCQVADVVVCHAGNGTLYQALSEGAPVVAVPEFHDQEFNMQRVEKMGLGVRVPPGPRLPERCMDGVRQVLADRAIAGRAEALAQRLRAQNGAHSAAQCIRRFVGLAGSADPDPPGDCAEHFASTVAGPGGAISSDVGQGGG